MLGAGFIANLHAAFLAGTSRPFSWSGVYDVDPARAEAFARRHGARIAGSEDEVITSCDVVYVCTWTSEHQRLVEAAAQQGVAVFCEKPLSTTLEGARQMTAAVGRAGVANQVGLVLRHMGPVRLARDLVRTQRAGCLMNLVLRDDQYLPVEGMYESTWRVDRKRAGSGVLLEHSIHDVDLIEAVAGQVCTVSARIDNFHGHDGVEDSVSALLVLSAGGSAVLSSVWHDILERPSSRRLEAFCEQLHVVVEDEFAGPVSWTFTGEEGRSTAGTTLDDELRARGLANGNPAEDFLEAVATGTPASPDFRTALRAHVLVDAIYRSAANGGTPIEVGPPDDAAT